MNCPCCGQPVVTKPKADSRASRAALVMAMRREGYTVREIAARIGRAVSTTQGIIDREREKNLG